MPLAPKNFGMHALNRALVSLVSGRSKDPKFYAEVIRAKGIAEKKAGRWANATIEDVMLEWYKRRIAADLYSTPLFRELRRGFVTGKMPAVTIRAKLLKLCLDVRRRIRSLRLRGEFARAGVTREEVRALTNSVLLGLVPKKAKGKGADIIVGEIEEAIRLGERDIQLE